MPGLYGIVGRDPGEAVAWCERLEALSMRRPGSVIETIRAGRLAAFIVRRHPEDAELAVVSDPDDRHSLLIQGRIYGAGGLTLDRSQPLRRLAADHLVTAVDPPAALIRLAGKFVAVHWDRYAERLSLVSDRFGSTPLYYSCGSGWFVFAPEASILCELPPVDSRCDPVAIAELLTFGYMLRDRTHHRGVRQLLPATRLSHASSGTRSEQYWEISFGGSRSDPAASLLAESRHLLRRSIRRCLEPGERICVPLSGGLDSRMIAAEAARHLAVLDTYTYGTPYCHDQKYASQVAAILGSRHCSRVLGPEYLPAVSDRFTGLTDGMVSLAHSSEFPALEEESGRHEVLISGYLGDPVAGSHLGRSNPLEKRYPRMAAKAELCELLLANHTRELSLASLERMWPISKGEIADGVRGDVERTVEDALCCNYPNDVGQYFDFRERQRRMVLPIMALANHFLECRLPFTDHDLVDFYFDLPVEHRLQQRLWVATLKAEYAEVAQVPWQATNCRPGAGILRRRLSRSELYFLYGTKRLLEAASRGRWSFDLGRLWAPYDRWFRQSLRQWTVSRMSYLGSLEGVDSGNLRRFVGRHLAGTTNSSFAVASLVTLSVFLRQRHCA